MKNILKFGEIRAKTAVSIVYYTLVIPIIVKAYLMAKDLYGTYNFYSNNSISKKVNPSDVIDTYVYSINNGGNVNILGINDIGNPIVLLIIFVLLSVMSLILCKMILELVLKFIQYFEKNNKNI